MARLNGWEGSLGTTHDKRIIIGLVSNGLLICSGQKKIEKTIWIDISVKYLISWLESVLIIMDDRFIHFMFRIIE